MYTVVKSSEASIRKITDNKIATNFITKEISSDFSLATTEAADYHEKEITNYNRVYYVLDGKLTITTEGDTIELMKDDACYLEEGTEYEMTGTFKAVVVNQPAFGTRA